MFNLANDPWIPVLGPAGPAVMSMRGLAQRLSERFVFVDGAGEVEVLTGAACWRLFLACHLAAVQEKTTLEAWLDDNAERFELFDPDRPFGQHPGLAPHIDEVGITAAMLPLFFANKGALLLDHTHNESDWGATPAQAARLMLVRQMFGTAQRQPFKVSVFGGPATNGKNTPNLVRPFTWLDTGGSLGDNLAANTPEVVDGTFRFGWPEGCTPGVEADLGTGVLDLLTWPARAVFLVPPGADGLVRTVAYAGGVPVPEVGQASQPHTLWRNDKAKGPVALRPGADAGWSSRFAEAWCADGLNDLLSTARPGWTVEVVGMVADKGRVDATYARSIPVPDKTQLAAWLDASSTVFKQTLGKATGAARLLGPDSANVDKAAAHVKKRLNARIDDIALDVFAGTDSETAAAAFRKVADDALAELAHAWSGYRHLDAALALEKN